MRTLRYTSAARDDLFDIADHVFETTRSAAIARRLTDDLQEKCRKLAELPGRLGTPRPELGQGLRSAAFKSYVIFFRYGDETIEIVNVLHGHRDIVAYFSDDV